MANTADKVIAIALKEVGYLEKKSNSKLYDKIANAGFNNYTKYAHEIDTKYPNFYNGKKNGYAYCDIFIDWCFIQAYGVDKAKELLCQPNKSLGAGCAYSMDYYKNKGQLYDEPEIGDQIFFKSGTRISHTGLVYDIDETYVYTVEGNTSSASGVIANGGAVAKKKYKLNYNRIAGYGRPKYDALNKTNQEISERTKVTYITHRIPTNSWGKEIVGYNLKNNMGYSGSFGKEIDKVAIKLSEGTITYCAHRLNDRWGNDITGYSKVNTNKYAGSAKKPIDAIAIKAEGINGKLKYRVHRKTDNKWGNWITGYSKTDTSNYAGSFGKPIDAIQIGIE